MCAKPSSEHPAQFGTVGITLLEIAIKVQLAGTWDRSMAAPLTTTTGSDSTDAAGNRFVALCTGATGISSVHLIRHLQQDPRFSKIYGVSRRELYDVDTTHAEHIKLDLLDSQKVKEELKSRGVSDGVFHY